MTLSRFRDGVFHSAGADESPHPATPHRESSGFCLLSPLSPDLGVLRSCPLAVLLKALPVQVPPTTAIPPVPLLPVTPLGVLHTNIPIYSLFLPILTLLSQLPLPPHGSA